MGLAIQNNNPGNLRDPATGAFRTFKTPQDGYAALMNDLDAKVNGASSTGLTPASTLYDFAKTYAPHQDNNNPEQYTVDLANRLGVDPTTQISQLKDRIPEFAYAVAQNEDADFANKYPLPGVTQAQSQQPSIDPTGHVVLPGQQQAQPMQLPNLAGGNSQNVLDNPQQALNGWQKNALGLVGMVTNPMERLGAGAANTIIGPVSNALGLTDYAPKTSITGITGEPLVVPGYDKNGNPVSALRAGGQVLGNVAELGMNMLPEAKAIPSAIGVAQEAIPGGAYSALSKVLRGAWQGGKYGAGYGLSESLANTDNPVQTAVNTAMGAAGGALVGGGLSSGSALLDNSLGLTKEFDSKLASAVDSGDADAVKTLLNSQIGKSRLRSLGVNSTEDIPVQRDKQVADIQDRILNAIPNATKQEDMRQWFTPKPGQAVSEGTQAVQDAIAYHEPKIIDNKPSVVSSNAAVAADTTKIADTQAQILEKVQQAGLNFDTPAANIEQAALSKLQTAGINEDVAKNWIQQEIEKQSRGKNGVLNLSDQVNLKKLANSEYHEGSSYEDNSRQAAARALGDAVREYHTSIINEQSNRIEPTALSAYRNLDEAFGRLQNVRKVYEYFPKIYKPGKEGWRPAFIGAMSAQGYNPIMYRASEQLSKYALQKYNQAMLMADMSTGGAKLLPNAIKDSIKIGEGAVERLSNMAADKSRQDIQEMITKKATDAKNAAVQRLMDILNPKLQKDIQMGPGAPKINSTLPVAEGAPNVYSSKSGPSYEPYTPDNKLPTINFAAAGIGLPAILDKIRSLGTEHYQREAPPQTAPEVLARQIAYAETRGEKQPYSFSQWSDKSLGARSPLGKALGKYQITEARLKEKSQDFLGRTVTPQEFLKSPSLQDRFIIQQVRWQRANGLSDQEILGTHRNGWGNMKPEQIKRSTDKAKQQGYIGTAQSEKEA